MPIYIIALHMLLNLVCTFLKNKMLKFLYSFVPHHHTTTYLLPRTSSHRCNQLIIDYHRLQIKLNSWVMSNFFRVYLFCSLPVYIHTSIHTNLQLLLKYIYFVILCESYILDLSIIRVT